MPAGSRRGHRCHLGVPWGCPRCVTPVSVPVSAMSPIFPHLGGMRDARGWRGDPSRSDAVPPPFWGCCPRFVPPVPGPRGAGRRCQPGCPAPVSDPPGGRGLGAYLTCPARPGGRTRSTGSSAAAMGSQLEGAMETLINVFHHYSGKEGDKYKLSKKELKELLQSELGCFLETQKDAGAVEKIMQDLDENGDGEVDFQEFVVLVAALTVACNTFFWENA
ncbi:protein S100-A1 isoform X1 [Molothrus aeneus]|uniref:protein S100-A1 isoform X1 n=1 Tax=Molothrus aeneus TaxID=84833 RepID=UPI0034581989